MHVFSNTRFALDLPAGHRFPMPKYELLRNRVEAELPAIRLSEAEPASEGELALAHTPEHIASVLHGSLSAAAQREIGFPWSERMVARSLRSVGATVSAARKALTEGVSCQLAGGTHHAYAHKGSGFCVFNDVAVAARLMQAETHRHHRRPLPVWVIDLDVHQGNGTAAIFADDPTVFTLSLHGEKNFPFRKEASDLDLALPDACGDRAYLTALDTALGRAWATMTAPPGQRRPGLAFYLAGADPHEGDRLGRLKLSAAALAQRDQRVLSFLQQQRVPVAICMAGGYGHDIAVTVELHMQTVRLALDAWNAWRPSVARR